jgi:uncharacterized membrane protein
MELFGFYLPYGLEWLNLLVRWLHVITGIAWIGASFYFVWLDNSLRPPAPGSDLGTEGRVRRAVGRARRRFLQSAEIHGGPRRAAGGTALVQMGSLFDLAVRLRAAHHRLLLQCPGHDGRPLRGRPDESWQAIGIGLGSLVLGWIVYDLLCRSKLGKHDLAFGGVIFLLLVGAAWVLTHWLSGRAAYIHVGAMIGTIMVANVAMVIIPGQRKVVNAMRAGRSRIRSTASAASSAASTTTTSRCRCCSS